MTSEPGAGGRLERRGLGDAGEPPHFDADFRARLVELFRWRRDVRSFRAEPIPGGVLDRLIALACLAPSVGLSEPWRVVTVDEPRRRTAIRACFEECNADALALHKPDRATLYARLKLAGLETAPVQFAVFAEREPAQGHGLGRQTMPVTVAYSAAMAVHTLWLAARAEGLGLGWVSIVDPTRVAAVLDVPEDWQLVGYFCLGYPVAESSLPELQREGWENRRPAENVIIRR